MFVIVRGSPIPFACPSRNGKKDIDVAGYLKDKTHLHVELMSCRRRLEFPIHKYPPKEESKDIILRAIITDAAEADIHLVLRATVKKKYTCFACITLACDQSRAYMPPKSAFATISSVGLCKIRECP